MYFINKKTIKISLTLLATTIASVATTVYAAGYIPLEPLTSAESTGVSLSTYLNDIFKIGIGLAGVFAVLMIVVGGIGYIAGASNPSARSEAKNKITNAIFGLILAAASWLILYTINPNLLKKGLNMPISSVKTANKTAFQTETTYCYLKVTGGLDKVTRNVCGSTCPTGENCTTKTTQVAIVPKNARTASGLSCGNNGGSTCVQGNVFCPTGESRDFGGSSCGTGYICCN